MGAASTPVQCKSACIHRYVCTLYGLQIRVWAYSVSIQRGAKTGETVLSEDIRSPTLPEFRQMLFVSRLHVPCLCLHLILWSALAGLHTYHNTRRGEGVFFNLENNTSKVVFSFVQPKPCQREIPSLKGRHLVSSLKLLASGGFRPASVLRRSCVCFYCIMRSILAKLCSTRRPSTGTVPCFCASSCASLSSSTGSTARRAAKASMKMQTNTAPFIATSTSLRGCPFRVLHLRFPVYKLLSRL